MTREPRPRKPRAVAARRSAAGKPPAATEAGFTEVVGLIRSARQRAAQAVNTTLIDLYWRIGEYLHRRIEQDGWKRGTVVRLAAFIALREPGLRGFSPQNLWRMRQFYETWHAVPRRLSTLLRVLPWSAHLHLLGRTRRPEEREFYLRMAAENRWPVRELERQIRAALFERAVLNPPKVSTALKVFHRGLNCLLAIELKITEFRPEHLGKLNFYLEALDRDARKPHENPSIGMLLCATKDEEVVEYALSPSLSPTLIAEYQTRLPDKRLLQAKLPEFYASNASAGDPAPVAAVPRRRGRKT